MRYLATIACLAFLTAVSTVANGAIIFSTGPEVLLGAGGATREYSFGDIKGIGAGTLWITEILGIDFSGITGGGQSNYRIPSYK